MDTTRVSWRTSSYSGNSGNQCVEVGTASGANHVLARDTKDRTGQMLRFTIAEWSTFVVGVKRSELT